MAGVVAGGCAPPPVAEPEPGPLVTLPAAQLSAILSQALQTGFDTATGASDEQRLLVGVFGSGGRHGPLVAIQPSDSLPYDSVDDLRAGRILARFVNRSAEPYPKLGVRAGADTVYWYVHADPTGRLSSLFVPADRSPAVDGGEVIVHRHSPDKWEQPIARWLWDDRDELGWTGCLDDACCTSGRTARGG